MTKQEAMDQAKKTGGTYELERGTAGQWKVIPPVKAKEK